MDNQRSWVAILTTDPVLPVCFSNSVVTFFKSFKLLLYLDTYRQLVASQVTRYGCIWQDRPLQTNIKLIPKLPTPGLVNRPGVAGAVLQSPPSFIYSLTDPLVQISSKHCQSQTGRARELKLWENVHLALCVMHHVSRVTCHVSPVTCLLTHVKISF